MNDQVRTPTIPSADQNERRIDSGIGVCVLLSALALWLALAAVWIINSTYNRYRGRTDLDMPDWFVINMDLTIKVLPLVAIAALLQIVSAMGFFTWDARTGWQVRIGFVAQWLAATLIVCLVSLSRLP